MVHVGRRHVAATCFDYRSLVAQVTFTRASEILIVEYWGSLEIVLTYVGAAPQVLRFSDLATAAFFQTDLERELLQDGWAFDISELNPLGKATTPRQRAQVALT
jgi:hypothetical protein